MNSPQTRASSVQEDFFKAIGSTVLNWAANCPLLAYILKQWIALLARSDWLLKLVIASTIRLRATLGAKASRAIISLILHASYVFYIFAARPPAGRSAFGLPRHLTKACRERTSSIRWIESLGFKGEIDKSFVLSRENSLRINRITLKRYDCLSFICS